MVAINCYRMLFVLETLLSTLEFDELGFRKVMLFDKALVREPISLDNLSNINLLCS